LLRPKALQDLTPAYRERAALLVYVVLAQKDFVNYVQEAEHHEQGNNHANYLGRLN
jgi:hypothetical protein